jgi:hypothetical protein
MSQQLIRFITLCLGGLVSCITFGAAPVKAQSAAISKEVNLQNGGYVGIGSAIGLSGSTTSLGTGGFTILTKVRFSDNLSLHDATVLFGNGVATSMIILTTDFPILNDSGQTIISPFIGGGAMLRYAQGLYISPAISGGIDMPLSKDLTGTIRLNAGFPSNRNADVGILVGAGYNFGK